MGSQIKIFFQRGAGLDMKLSTSLFFSNKIKCKKWTMSYGNRISCHFAYKNTFPKKATKVQVVHVKEH